MKGKSDIQWGGVEVTGTSLRGMFSPLPYSFEETVARLIQASAQPAESMDQYKTSVEFTGTFRGQAFTLYDYKEDRELHIGGREGLDVKGLVKTLRGELTVATPTPYHAAEYYDERQGHGWPPPTKQGVGLGITVPMIAAVPALIEALRPIAAAYPDDPGTSDLDNEQPVTITLGDVRRVWRALGKAGVRPERSADGSTRWGR